MYVSFELRSPPFLRLPDLQDLKRLIDKNFKGFLLEKGFKRVSKEIGKRGRKFKRSLNPLVNAGLTMDYVIRITVQSVTEKLPYFS